MLYKYKCNDSLVAEKLSYVLKEAAIQNVSKPYLKYFNETTLKVQPWPFLVDIFLKK